MNIALLYLNNYKIEDKYKFTVTKLWGGGVPIYFPLQCEP